MKRGQGMSINMLILIALGIAVLIIAVLMLMNGSKKGNAAINDCETLGGVCETGKCNTQTNICSSCSTSPAFGSCADKTSRCCQKPTA